MNDLHMSHLSVPAPSVFNLFDLASQDYATLAIRHPKTGEVTSWVWTFYGPGHAKSIAVADQASRDTLKRIKEQRQAISEGKKFDEPIDEPSDLRARNVGNIVARTKDFTAVNLGTGTTTFSVEVAGTILRDRRFGWLLTQIVEFLSKEENFIQPSGKI